MYEWLLNDGMIFLARGQPNAGGHEHWASPDGGVICEKSMRVERWLLEATGVSRALRGEMRCEELRQSDPENVSFLYTTHEKTAFTAWLVFNCDKCLQLCQGTTP